MLLLVYCSESAAMRVLVWLWQQQQRTRSSSTVSSAVATWHTRCRLYVVKLWIIFQGKILVRLLPLMLVLIQTHRDLCWTCWWGRTTVLLWGDRDKRIFVLLRDSGGGRGREESPAVCKSCLEWTYPCQKWRSKQHQQVSSHIWSVTIWLFWARSRIQVFCCCQLCPL